MMLNRSRKSVYKSWGDRHPSKASPRPSNLDLGPTASPDLAVVSSASCLSDCLDAFQNSISPHDEDLEKIC